MKVSEKEVAYVAGLAHLELAQEEQSLMVRDLNSILGFIDTLNELDTSNIEPMAQVMTSSGSIDALRADSGRPSLAHEDAINNAPDHNSDFFTVPKVIER